MGVFIYNEISEAYEQKDGKIHWTLDIQNECIEPSEMIKRAEELFLYIEKFVGKAKVAIAGTLLDYKNDFWPAYDENDETLDWDAVDAGKYDMSKEEFIESITLCDIQIRGNGIYCEFDDGDLFGGHRIHAYFDNNYALLKADV